MVLPRACYAVSYCLLLLGVVTPFRALGGPVMMVVDLSDGGAFAARRHLLEEIYGTGLAPQVMLSAEALDGGSGPWAASPVTALVPCDASPVTGSQLQESLDAVEGHMLALEYGKAQPTLAALEDQLCAAMEPVPAELLSRISFLQGIVLTYDGQQQEAEAAFMEALLLHPSLTWDANFSPQPQALFERAASTVQQQPVGRLLLDSADGPTRLFIDGVEIPSRHEIIEVAGSRHLLQLEWGGVFVTRWMDMGPSEEIQLRGPQRLLELLQAQAPNVAFDRLVEVAHSRGYTRIVVLENATAPTAWTYDDVHEAWSSLSWVQHQQQRRARKTRTAGGIVLAVGGALTVGGVAVGISNYNQGFQLIDEMQQDLGMYRLLIDEYEANRRGAQAGFTVMAIGGTLLAMGLPMLLHSSKVIREPPRIAVAIAPSPAGMSIQFSWRGIHVQGVCEDK